MIADAASILLDQPDLRNWTKYDFQRERFQSYIQDIETILASLISDVYDATTNDEFYDLVMKKRYNVVVSNCLLLVLKIINFEERGGDRLQNKGFPGLRQREERGVRFLRRNVEKDCTEFFRSLCAAGEPFNADKGQTGVFTGAELEERLAPLGPFPHQPGLLYNFRLGIRILVQTLNDACTYQGGLVYKIDKNKLAQAFEIGARYIEWALSQHATDERRTVPEDDLAITSQLNSLTINSGPRCRVTSYRWAPSCTNCEQTGHSFRSCPRIECYRCKC